MKFSILLIALISPMLSLSQGVFYETLNNSMKQIASTESEENRIKFKPTARIKPETIFEEHKTAFELSTFDKMKVNKSFKDDIGFTHINYQQHYKGILIDGESVNVHTNKNGETYAATGRILKGLSVEILPKLTEQEAIDIALKFVNAKEYMWESTFWENDLKEKTSKTDTTYYPKPTLVVKEKQGFSSGTGIFHLAYRINTYSSSPFYSQRI